MYRDRGLYPGSPAPVFPTHTEESGLDQTFVDREATQEISPHHGLELVEALSELGCQFGLKDYYRHYLEESGFGTQLDLPLEQQNPELRRLLGLIALSDELQKFQPQNPVKKLFKKAAAAYLEKSGLDLKILKVAFDMMLNKPTKSEETWRKLLSMFDAVIAVLPKALEQWQAEDIIPVGLQSSLAEVAEALSAKTETKSPLEQKITIDLIGGLAMLVNLSEYDRDRLRYTLLTRLVPVYSRDSLKRYSQETMEGLQSYGLLDVPLYLSTLQDATHLHYESYQSYKQDKITGYRARPSSDAVSAVSYNQRLEEWEILKRNYEISRYYVQGLLSLLQGHMKTERRRAFLDKDWAVAEKQTLVNLLQNAVSSTSIEEAWNYWQKQGSRPRALTDTLFGGYRYFRLEDFAEVKKATLECIEFVRTNDTQESDELLLSLLSLWNEKLRLIYELTVE